MAHAAQPGQTKNFGTYFVCLDEPKFVLGQSYERLPCRDYWWFVVEWVRKWQSHKVTVWQSSSWLHIQVDEKCSCFFRTLPSCFAHRGIRRGEIYMANVRSPCKGATLKIYDRSRDEVCVANFRSLCELWESGKFLINQELIEVKFGPFARISDKRRIVGRYRNCLGHNYFKSKLQSRHFLERNSHLLRKRP
jgi:hypothetical protein